MDENVGRILATLESHGLRENTLIIFLSDNGGTINTYSNNQPLNGYKYMFGEGGIRIPMIFSQPGRLPEGKSLNQMVSAMDVFPTILELIGGKIPPNLDGRSLAGSLRGDRKAIHEMLFWSNGMEFKEYKNPTEAQAANWVVRIGPWKLVHSGGWTHANYELKDGIAYPAAAYYYPKGILLFNLDKDMGETTNLAEEHPELVEEMSLVYEDWKAKMLPPRRGEETLTITQSMLK